MTKKLISTFCKCGGGVGLCPQLFFESSAPEQKQVQITDDFGNTISMSAVQFKAMVSQAKKGDLDNIEKK